MKSSLLFTVLLLACHTSAIGQAKQSVLELTIDKEIMSLPCPHPFPAKYRTCPDGMIVNVEATINGKTEKKHKFEYSVSGGMVVGDGSKVVWDLARATPGTYVITAIGYSGSKKARTSVRRTVTVLECVDCNQECLQCPYFDIHGSKDSISPGDVIELRLTRPEDLRYEWVVDGGVILSGQGTDHITIKVDPKITKSAVLITVRIIDGGFCTEVGGCPDHANMELQVNVPRQHGSLPRGPFSPERTHSHVVYGVVESGEILRGRFHVLPPAA